MEILNTEKRYVGSLKTLQSLYINPLRGDERIMTKAEYQQLFSKMEMIIGVNDIFLKDLEKKLQDWKDDIILSDVFNDFFPFFRSYYKDVGSFFCFSINVLFVTHLTIPRLLRSIST